MSNLITTCMRDKDKDICPRGVTRCALKRCVGCVWSNISRRREKSKMSTQYHLKPMELPYSCSAIKRSCDTHPPYGNDVQCVGCRYQEPVREPKHEKGEPNGIKTRSSLQKSRG